MTTAYTVINYEAVGSKSTILPFWHVVISAIGNKNFPECLHSKYASLPPPQLSSFSTRVLTVLENNADQQKTWETLEY